MEFGFKQASETVCTDGELTVFPIAELRRPLWGGEWRDGKEEKGGRERNEREEGERRGRKGRAMSRKSPGYGPGRSQSLHQESTQSRLSSDKSQYGD